ncbi:MAG: hypothetical protein IJR60_04045 [Eubacterium sp.]|nr:hypothetical protein [Eubacterium sp.]
MAKKKNGVSGKTHTQAQLDNYANQHNPNNKAYKANKQNQRAQKNKKAPYVDDFDYSGFGPFYWD